MLVLRNIAFLAVLALAAPLVIAPAHALVDGPWIEEEPARYRMIAAEVDGAPYAALQMELKPGWYTYWRYPGPAGWSLNLILPIVAVCPPIRRLSRPISSTMGLAALMGIRMRRVCFPALHGAERRIAYARHDWRMPRGLRADECGAKSGFQSRRAEIITA